MIMRHLLSGVRFARPGEAFRLRRSSAAALQLVKPFVEPPLLTERGQGAVAKIRRELRRPASLDEPSGLRP
jgi:hypothetical protein